MELIIIEYNKLTMNEQKYLYEEGNELVEIEDEQELENVIVKMFETIDMDDLLRELKEKLEEKELNNDLNTNQNIFNKC